PKPRRGSAAGRSEAGCSLSLPPQAKRSGGEGRRAKRAGVWGLASKCTKEPPTPDPPPLHEGRGVERLRSGILQEEHHPRFPCALIASSRTRFQISSTFST